MDTIKTVNLTLPTGLLAFPIPLEMDTVDVLLDALGNCLFDFEQFFLPINASIDSMVSYFGTDYKKDKDATFWMFQFTPKLNYSMDSVFNTVEDVLQHYKDSLINETQWQNCCLVRNNIQINQENNMETRNQDLLNNMLLTGSPLKPSAVPLTKEKFRMIINEYFRPEKSFKLILLPSRIN